MAGVSHSMEFMKLSWNGNNPNMKHWDVDGIMPMESNPAFRRLLGSLTVGLND